MSLQKEKGLSPQKKNLKPKRESEACATLHASKFMRQVLA